MKVDIRKIVSESEFKNDLDIIFNRIETEKEFFIFKHNKPNYVLMTIDKYKQLVVDGDDTKKLQKSISKKHVHNAIVEKVHDNVGIVDSNDLKIGKMARTLIPLFLREHVITDEEINLMQEDGYSKKVFNLNYPALKKVDKKIDLENQKMDHNGYSRYYSPVISVSGNDYIVCSQWYEHDRDKFEKWLQPKLMKILLEKVTNLTSGTEFTVNGLLSEYWISTPYSVLESLEKNIIERFRYNLNTNVIKLDKTIGNARVYRKLNK